ncbi:T9SS type A sorting domain-containing protein [bacterium]|nr:T9SS type A sorting domain-containing protein [bacterium]
MRKVVFALLFFTMIVITAFAGNYEKTAYQAIKDDYQNGLISTYEYIENLISSVKSPESLDPSYAGTYGGRSGTIPLVEAYNMIQSLAESERSRFRPAMSRPWGLSQTYSTTHFYFHYTTSGSDATTSSFVTQMGTAFENAWAHLATTRGFDTPPSDGSAGGNSKYDIYIRNLSSGILGYCEPETNVPSTPQNDATSFINMRNSYSSYSYNPVQLMQQTAVHELFHSFQMGYDASESPWWMEISSVWIEDNMYPGYDEEHAFLSEFFDNPDVTIQTYNGAHEYGSYHFATYLTAEFGSNTILDIWEQCKWVGVLAAIQGVASDEGSSRNDCISEFFVWNLFTGSRYIAGDYPEGDDFPEIHIEDVIYTSDYPVIGGSSSHPPDNLASNYFKLTVPSGASGPFSISFDGENGGIWSAQLVFPLSTTYSVLDLSLDTYGYGYYTVPESVYSEFGEIYLVVGMLSTSGEDWNFEYSAAFDTITAALNPPRNLRATSDLSGHVPLEWDAPIGGGGEEEISYDDGSGETYVGLTAGDIEGLKFTYPAACSLVSIKFMAYSSTTYPNMGVHIYPESGGDVPDTSAEIGTSRVVTPEAAPSWTELSVATENIGLPAGDFFVGIEHTAVEPSLLIDTGTPGETSRCWGLASTGFWGLADGTGVFMLRAVIKTGARYIELTPVNSDGEPLVFSKSTPLSSITETREPIELSTSIVAEAPRLRPTEAPMNYNVYRSSVPGGPWTWPIATPGAQTYDDLTVTDDNTYYYTVTAQYASGESGPTNQVSATPNSGGGDTTDSNIIINADLDDTLSPLTYWPISPGAKFAERLELDRPAKIKSLLYYALNIGAGQFIPGIHHWTGDRIEGELLPSIPHTAVGTTLVVIDVDAYDIYVNSDFVVSFEIYDSTSFVLSQQIPSDNHDWMNLGFGWFIPDSARFVIGAQIEYVDSTERYSLSGYINLSGGTGGSPPPSDISGSIVKIEGLDLADTTDATGYYQIDDLEPGTYIVSANRNWYESQSALVSLNTNDRKDFNLIPYNLPVNPPRLLTAESFHNGEVPLHWWAPMGSPGTAEWHTYWEYPDSLFYFRPNLSVNSVECTRFDLWAPCTLTTARLCFYDSTGVYDNIEFHIWGDDGAGFPDFTNDLITPRVITPVPYSPTAGLQWTYVNLESLGIPLQLLPGDQIHIGVKHLTSHPSLIFDETTPLESPTRSKIYSADISNWDADLADFLLEVYAKYFDYTSRPSPDGRTPEPPEIKFVSKDCSRIPAATSPRMRPMEGIAVEFYDIYHTTDLMDTSSFALIATVLGDSIDWTHTSATNDIWNAYYIKTHQSHGISDRSDYALAYPKSNTDSAKVLLVDDDGSSWGGGIDESWAYIDAFDSLDIEFDAIDLNGSRVEGPDAADMFDYDVVIWFTGILYSDSTTLMDSDEDNIETYLSAGGNFALFSQDYLWDRYESGISAGSFPARTFGLDSVQQDVCTITQEDVGIVLGNAGGPFDGMGMLITSPFGTFDLAPDGLFGPSPLADLSFGPFTGPSITGKTTSSSKTIFSSIPLSAIYDTTAPNSKYDFIQRLLDDYFEIFGPENVDIVYNMRPGWNLVSLPVELDNNTVSAVFPGHSSDVYFYDTDIAAYAIADSVIPGIGYWVLYTSLIGFTHTGPPINSWTHLLDPGWNMVGSVMADTIVPFSSATFIPNAYLSGNFYGYDGSVYVPADGFTPGAGYWILVSAECNMTLNNGARGRITPPATDEQIISAFGNELRIGIGTEKIGYIPPSAPFSESPKAFLRHNGQECLRVIVENGRWEIELTESGLIRTSGENSILIESSNFSKRLDNGEELYLSKGVYSIIIVPIPKNLDLNTAKPNPFNASTTIGFDLPKDSSVELDIYSIDGKLIKRLISGNIKAGSHSIVWDGRTDSGDKASSGVYLYKLSSENETQTRKMTLIE